MTRFPNDPSEKATSEECLMSAPDELRDETLAEIREFDVRDAAWTRSMFEDVAIAAQRWVRDASKVENWSVPLSGIVGTAVELLRDLTWCDECDVPIVGERLSRMLQIEEPRMACVCDD